MTLILDAGAGSGPQVHVLVIGVGSYRHLPGGTEPVEHDTFGLGQLSSPPLSARTLVDWITAQLRHPTASLGTVELLLSPSEEWPLQDGDPLTVELPTLANVKRAFDAWFDRCDAHEDNIAVLYFCGHGVERESQFLLLEDFGAASNRMLENAVDIGLTYRALAQCKAREQFVFVDACRQLTFQVAQYLTDTARPLLDPKLKADLRRNAALMFATSGGQMAYARPGQPTRFTLALLRALEGLGSTKAGVEWVVQMQGIHSAVVAQLAGEKDAPRQSPMTLLSGAGPLHVCAGPPIVPLSVRCLPGEASAGAQIVLAPSAPKAANASPEPQAAEGGWDFNVPADIYRLSLEFPPGTYPATECQVSAFPPGTEMAVPVTA